MMMWDQKYTSETTLVEFHNFSPSPAVIPTGIWGICGWLRQREAACRERSP